MNKTLCSFCGKEATKLCDAPIGKSRCVGHPPRTEMMKAKQWDVAFRTIRATETITCNRPICDNCAAEVHPEIDYCPDCVKRVKLAAAARMGRRTKHESM